MTLTCARLELLPFICPLAGLDRVAIVSRQGGLVLLFHGYVLRREAEVLSKIYVKVITLLVAYKDLAPKTLEPPSWVLYSQYL